MDDEQTTFKVTDRRLFNADGTPRDLPPQETPEPAPASLSPGANATATAPSDAIGAPPHAHAASSQRGSPPVATARQESDEPGDIPGADDPASFINFAMSIASNAASSLGMMEHPVSHKREVDLELAKHWIDVLGMLEQKTRGNLVAEEEQILDGLLADLRMQYVSLAGSATQGARQSYSGRDITGGR